MSRARAQRGQATVELVALLPVLGTLLALAWQAVVAGQAVWLSGAAARAASRAQAVGGDPRAAARAALPAGLRAGVAVRSLRGDGVEVSVGVPAVLVGGRLGSVHARARFAPQGR